MNIKRRLTGAAAVLLACIAALVFAALVPARAIPPSGGRQYRGIDISEFQGEIDFEEVRRSGIEAVYIRVGAGGIYRRILRRKLRTGEGGGTENRLLSLCHRPLGRGGAQAGAVLCIPCRRARAGYAPCDGF